MAFKGLENNPILNTEAQERANKPKRGRPQSEHLVRGNSVQEGLTAEYQRATFIVRVDLLKKLKDYAYTERKDLKVIINEVLEDVLSRVDKQYEAEGKELLSKDD